jgi:hypothetical protein
MKLFIRPASLLLGLSLVLMPTIASAQPDTFGNSGDQRDAFGRAATGDTSGLLNLINQAQINSKINPNYASQQREQITSATEDFRSQQLKVLRDQNKKAVPTTSVTPK